METWAVGLSEGKIKKSVFEVQTATPKCAFWLNLMDISSGIDSPGRVQKGKGIFTSPFSFRRCPFLTT